MSSHPSAEHKAGFIAALLQEHKHYETYGPEERLEQVNSQLASLGHGAKTASKRAEKRPSKRSETR